MKKYGSSVMFILAVVAPGPVAFGGLAKCDPMEVVVTSGLCEILSCSNEVKQSNVVKLDNLVDQFQKLPELKDAGKFHAWADRVSKVKEPLQRLQEYGKVFNVDTNDIASVSAFAGARDRSVYIRNAQSKLGLEKDQVSILIQETIRSVTGARR